MQRGERLFDNEVRQIIGEENYFKVSDQFLGFAYEDVEEHISEEAQRIRCYLQNRGKKLAAKVSEKRVCVISFPL